MDKLFYDRYWLQIRKSGIVALAMSPLTAPFVHAVNLIASLLKCAPLFGPRGSHYNGFASAPAFLKTFYYTQALNLSRHGRRGTSPTLGLGNFSMKWFWYQSYPSLLLQQQLGGAKLALLGMSCWLVSFGFFPTAPEFGSLGKLFFLILIALSSNFLGNLFVRQNYNVAGWVFFPLALLALLQGNIPLLAVCCFIISVFSITVFSCVSALVVSMAISNHWELLWALAAGTVPITFNFFRTNGTGIANSIKLVRALFGAIGGHSQVRYKRPRRYGHALLSSVALSVFPLGIYLLGVSLPQLTPLHLAVFTGVPVVWFFLNQSKIFRIADVQSLLMLFLSVSAAVTLLTGDLRLVFLFWITNCNPLINLQLFSFDVPQSPALPHFPKVEPFNIEPFSAAVDQLLSPARPGDTILVACDDPGDDYNRVFDGFSDVYELLHFRANCQQINTFPDWYAVSQLNDWAAPDIWGRSPERISKNILLWKAQYVLVYCRSGLYNEQYWSDHGFETVSRLDWKALQPSLKTSPLFQQGAIEWALLRTNLRE